MQLINYINEILGVINKYQLYSFASIAVIVAESKILPVADFK